MMHFPLRGLMVVLWCIAACVVAEKAGDTIAKSGGNHIEDVSRSEGRRIKYVFVIPEDPDIGPLMFEGDAVEPPLSGVGPLWAWSQCAWALVALFITHWTF